MRKYLSLFLLFLLLACSGDDETLQREVLLDMAREGDPDLEVLLPASLDKQLVNCRSYTPACSTGYKIRIKNLEIIALEYGSKAEALKCAKRINGLTTHNWAFDDVVGEPILERFFKKWIKAKSPSELKKSE